MRVLVVGGSPEVICGSRLSRLCSECDMVVAVDRGLDVLLDNELTCDLFCGDADTVGPLGKRLVSGPDHARGFEVERYDPHKDATDLDLALSSVRKRVGGADIVATCLSGGKPDHFLAALGRLLAWRDGAVHLVEDGFVGRLLHAGDSWDLASYRGRRFSFVPLSPDAVVSERGMRWTLESERVELLSDRGIANELDGADALITCHEGSIGAWVYLGE